MPVIYAFAAALILAFSQWLIFFYAPVEATLGIIQKIFYFHLPLAIWAMTSFLLVFIASILYIAKRDTAIDALATAATEIGVLFSVLALSSGIIWAKRSWGVWWTWDPRLTTTLVMFFIYAALLVFRQLDFKPERKRLVCSVIGIVAFLDVPLVFLSARIFRSIHPAVYGNQQGGLDPAMRLVSIVCLVGMGLFWLALLLLRRRQLCIEERLSQLVNAKIFASGPEN